MWKISKHHVNVPDKEAFRDKSVLMLLDLKDALFYWSNTTYINRGMIFTGRKNMVYKLREI